MQQAILIDWGYDRGLLFCENCNHLRMHDLDKAVNPKKISMNVPIWCRECLKPKVIRKKAWIRACKLSDRKLLLMFGLEKKKEPKIGK